MIEHGEASLSNNHKTPKWARILIGLFVVVLGCVAYLWFFGSQTLIVLEARYLTRKTPAVSMAPAQLTDFSISQSPGRKLSYFGYDFEVPWNDVDEAKSGLIPDSNKAMIVFQSGNSLSVWHGSPRAFLNIVLSNDKIDQNTLRRIVGDEALQSDYALYRTILQMTPDKMTPFESQSDAANQALLLLVKGNLHAAGCRVRRLFCERRRILRISIRAPRKSIRQRERQALFRQQFSQFHFYSESGRPCAHLPARHQPHPPYLAQGHIRPHTHRAITALPPASSCSSSATPLTPTESRLGNVYVKGRISGYELKLKVGGIDRNVERETRLEQESRIQASNLETKSKIDEAQKKGRRASALPTEFKCPISLPDFFSAQGDYNPIFVTVYRGPFSAILT
jgi:hypothetical protein